jgi:hypothetical protein
MINLTRRPRDSEKTKLADLQVFCKTSVPQDTRKDTGGWGTTAGVVSQTMVPRLGDRRRGRALGLLLFRLLLLFLVLASGLVLLLVCLAGRSDQKNELSHRQCDRESYLPPVSPPQP